MKTYTARGIVLHTVKYGDSSLVVYMLTDVLGRQTYMVQGVRSRTGRGNKAALFQPMFTVELQGVEMPGAGMHRIREVSSLLPLSSLPFDVRKSTIALFMAEVLYKLVREVEPDAPLFDFVLNSVKALDSMEQGCSNFHLWFLVRLSYYLGFYPGNDYLPGSWFDIAEGCFCAIKPHHAATMEPGQAATLGQVMSTGLEDIHTLPLSGGRRSEFLASMLNYFGHHLDAIHSVQSINILREVF